MITLQLAQQLKESGLIWRTDVNDFFGIPDRGLDDRIFVLSDMMANLDLFRGWPVVTFHGASEWALDYILTSETVWLPREDQLRGQLVDRLPTDAPKQVRLEMGERGYTCSIQPNGRLLDFSGETASEAYGHALLHLLQAAAD